MSLDTASSAILQFRSEADEIRYAPEPLALRAATLVLSIFLVACLALSAVARVDRVITSERGKIVPPANGTTLFQALDNSIIKTLEVKEGDQVKKGQLLATLDPTFASADVEQLQNQLDALEAQIARAKAEQAGTEYRPSRANGTRNPYEVLQQNMFEQRAAQLKSQTASFDSKIAQTQTTIRRLEGDELRYREREKISQQVESMRQQLVEKQAGSLLNLLLASDSRLEMLRMMESGRDSLVEARHQLEGLVADRAAFIQQWLATSSQDLVTAQQTKDGVLAQLKKASRLKELIRLEAPDDGVVLTRSKLSVGSVLRAGDTLLTLVGLNTPIEAEVNIAARDVGFVRADDPVTLKVDAFEFVQHGYAEGKIRWISEGAFTVDEDGKAVEPFYKARVSVDKMEFVRVPETFRLIPGMTLAADIHIGSRSVLSYLVSGGLGGLRQAMREP